MSESTLRNSENTDDSDAERTRYWTPILTHPDIEPMVLAGLGSVGDFVWWLDQSETHEERAPGGGFVFVDKGPDQEVHVAFLPEYWGRSVAASFRRVFARKMREGRTILAREQEGEWRTRPPKSHGWELAGEWEPSILPRRTRLWRLTPDAWYRSRVGRATDEFHN